MKKTILLLAFLSSVPSFAQSNASSDLFAGATLGLSSISGDVGSGLGFGLNGGWYLNPNFGVGLFLNSGSHSNGVTSFMWGGRLLIRAPEFLPGAWLSGDVGDTKVSGGQFDGGYNLTGGARIGYDVPVAQNFSLGGEAGLEIFKPQSNTLTVFDLQAAAKIWFK